MAGLETWLTRLHDGAFANLGGARKSIGKAGFTDKERAAAEGEAAAYFSSTQAEGSDVPPIVLRREILSGNIHLLHKLSEAMYWLKQAHPRADVSDAQTVIDSVLPPILTEFSEVVGSAKPAAKPAPAAAEGAPPASEPSNGKTVKLGSQLFNDLAPGDSPPS